MISTKTLLQAAEQAKKVINTKSIPPVLKNILLEFEQHELTITSTDLVNTYQQALNIDRVTDFKATIDAAAFVKILKAVKTDRLRMTKDQETILIDTGKTVFKLPIIDANEYPAALPYNETYTEILTIKAADLKKLELFANRGKNSFSNVLSAINIRPETGALCTCDGNRLLKYQSEKITNYNKDINIYAEIIKILPDGLYIISANNEHIKLTNTASGECFYTINIDGQYPRYEQLIPCHNTEAFKLNQKELTEALKEIEITLNPRTSIMQFEFDKGNQKLFLTSETPDVGETKTQVTTICSDLKQFEFNDIALNYGYLKEFNSISKTIRFELGSGNLSGVLLLFDDKEFTGLLMPVQIRK